MKFGFSHWLSNQLLSSLFYLFQLIGWQDVQRPNSRTEIVQAMRRIRVSHIGHWNGRDFISLARSWNWNWHWNRNGVFRYHVHSLCVGGWMGAESNVESEVWHLGNCAICTMNAMKTIDIQLSGARDRIELGWQIIHYQVAVDRLQTTGKRQSQQFAIDEQFEGPINSERLAQDIRLCKCIIFVCVWRCWIAPHSKRQPS